MKAQRKKVTVADLEKLWEELCSAKGQRMSIVRLIDTLTKEFHALTLKASEATLAEFVRKGDIYE